MCPLALFVCVCVGCCTDSCEVVVVIVVVLALKLRPLMYHLQTKRGDQLANYTEGRRSCCDLTWQRLFLFCTFSSLPFSSFSVAVRIHRCRKSLSLSLFSFLPVIRNVIIASVLSSFALGTAVLYSTVLLNSTQLCSTQLCLSSFSQLSAGTVH